MFSPSYLVASRHGILYLRFPIEGVLQLRGVILNEDSMADFSRQKTQEERLENLASVTTLYKSEEFGEVYVGYAGKVKGLMTYVHCFHKEKTERLDILSVFTR